jgi:hypothetical protein
MAVAPLSGFLDQKSIDALQETMEKIQKANGARDKLKIIYKDTTNTDWELPLVSFQDISIYITNLKSQIMEYHTYYNDFVRLENSYNYKI